jgi:iron complex outermembrane receptor protein
LRTAHPVLPGPPDDPEDHVKPLRRPASLQPAGLLLAAALLALMSWTAVHAQPAAGPASRDTAVYRVAPVTVRGVRPQTTAGGASAVDVALDSTIVRPAPTLEQVLRTMPLVAVRTNSRGEVQPALRGAEDRQIAVLVDGVPITLAWDHRTDLSVVPVSAARNVTLHRGLSSLLLGPNALAGAVEVDVARGSRADAPPPPLMLDLGVDQTGTRSAALTAGTLRSDSGGRWLVRGGGGYRGSEGFALPRALQRADAATYARLTSDGDRRLNTDLEAFDGFLSLRRVNRAGAWGSVTAAGYRLERGIAPEAHTSAPRLWRYPYQARALGAVSAGTGMRSTPWGRGDLEASLGLDVGRTEIDQYDGLDYRTVVGGERGDDRTLTTRLLGDHTLGRHGDLRMALTYADVSHEEVVDGGALASYRQRLWSLASETDWRLTLGVPVRASVGVAADGADTPESSDKPALGRLWDWGARVGATAVFHRGAVLAHASSGRRARFPALRELYSGALGRFVPNPGLGPETQWTSEVGVTLRQPRGEVQVVGFHQVLEDAITRISVTAPTGTKYQRVNLGRVSAQGLEVLGDITAGAFAAGGNLTLQHVRGRGADGKETDLEYEPAVYGGAWGEVGLPGRTRLGLEAHATGEQRFIDLDQGGFSTLAPSVRFDLRVSRTFDLGPPGPWRSVEALIALENLADQPVFDQAGLPQAGRTVRLQARLR